MDLSGQKRALIITIILLSFIELCSSKQYILSGIILDKEKHTPIEYATVYLPKNELWAISDNTGKFTIERVPEGEVELDIQYLGYKRKLFTIKITDNIKNLKIEMSEDNLKLKEVVVTSNVKSNSSTTIYEIGRNSLDHEQVVNASSLTSLLPGGKTVNQNLANSAARITLHAEDHEMGNASFGTAVTVDGVRLQNNSEMSETKGADLRNVSSSNIESVEIITGIPSVEYGDLSNGIVKIHTKKGKTPYNIELSTEPKTKHISLNKGFLLGDDAGTLNASLEHTRSISSLASPFTSYNRNTFTLNYNNTFNKTKKQPLTFNVGFSGNVGGFNSKADPDAFKNTYTKVRDYSFRGNAKLNWLLNKSWITNVSLLASVIYSDKKQTENTNNSSASSKPLIHSTEEGYFVAEEYDKNPNANIILGPTGYWYELGFVDNKPIAFSLKGKADWARRWGIVLNKLMIGVEWNCNGNKGRGLYYDDMRYAPTWREMRYDTLPYMHNTAIFAEEKLSIKLYQGGSLQITAGVRGDITSINESEYGTASSFSPRFNAKYNILEKTRYWVSDLNIYGGWGKAVKLPSFEILFPRTSYTDQLSFAPGTTGDGKTFYAYHTFPSRAIYNEDLKWQYSNQAEIGLEAIIKGTRISISAYKNTTLNPYINQYKYLPYTYKQTTQEHLNNCQIPSSNREYNIDRTTGIVTVIDRTGKFSNHILGYKERNDFQTLKYYTNGSPITRYGIDWVVDFTQIPVINTKIRVDGNFYYYKGLDNILSANIPVTSNMSDGNPYKYIGFYSGTRVSNGNESKNVNLNVTITTHIPKIRMIVSLRLESSLYSYDKNLSEYADGGDRGYIIENSKDYFGVPYTGNEKDKFIAVYPEYFSTWENPDKKINFKETFIWAKKNDQKLFNELGKMVLKTNNNFFFNPDRVSAYFSMNLNITKEIGDFASISFFAKNFFNNTSTVTSTQTGFKTTIYNSGYIPAFYYGLSLRLKI